MGGADLSIKLEHIDKYYYRKKQNENHALKDISFEIGDGELVAVVGRSGAGKSTLLHILGCIDSYQGGSYKLNGTAIEKLSDKEKSRVRNEEVGIVLQDFGLVDGYTVAENVMTPLHFSKIRSRAKKEEMVRLALERVGISELYGCKVNKISGGQKQRTAIARAIVNSPSLLLADEPTGALDVETASEIMAVFRELNHAGITVIIVTHDPSVAALCDRSITISDGRVVPES